MPPANSLQTQFFMVGGEVVKNERQRYHKNLSLLLFSFTFDVGNLLALTAILTE